MNVQSRSAGATGRASGGRRVAAVVLSAAALLAGCASLDEAHVEVAGYGGWPSGRSPGTFRFERLPSQQSAGPAQQDQVEAAAATALARAGFRPAPPDAEPDVLVQAGVRSSREVDARWDPFWGNPYPWGGVYGRWGGRRSVGMGVGVGLGWGWSSSPPRDVQESVLLLIDRPEHKVLYEGRARTELRGNTEVWRAMFRATLDGFPQLPGGARELTVPLREAPTSSAR